MGRNSGSSNGEGALQEGDSSYKGRIRGVESLKEIQDQQAYKEMKKAISRYEAVMGVRTTNVKLATLDGNVMGIGNDQGVYLSKSYFKGKTKSEVEGDMRKQYKSGWQTETNKPYAHVVTHELAHATWQSSRTSAKHVAAGKEITKVYKQWMADSKKKGYGAYSKTNRDEFFAETVTKAVHGTPDKYTRRIKAIVKKYQL